MNLPTAKEINPFDDLDGQCAERHFLGKSLEEAEALLRKASTTYLEDLMHMGPRAFRFYFRAAISYIRSEAATGDSYVIDGFAGLLELRLEFEPQELVAVAEPLASICAYIVEHHDRFDLEPEIYGDVRPRFEALQRAFLEQFET
ncbi:MAG: hypothetical protein EXS05_10980 [Planctomycetaceae bacterium]|nr:hypothetical protein [Planctomycetaceae bacterium]